MSMREHTLIWSQDVNMDMIIDILKRNYNDENRYGLCCGAAWYHFNEQQAALLNEKGYKVKADVKYLFIRQEQPYLNINCIFGYDDNFEIKEGCCTMYGSAYEVEYTDEEKAEIEKMDSIELYEEFEFDEAEEIFATLEEIDLRKPEKIVETSKIELEKAEQVLANIENATLTKILSTFNMYMGYNNYVAMYELPNGEEYICFCNEKDGEVFNIEKINNTSSIDTNIYKVTERPNMHNELVTKLKESIQEFKDQIKQYS